MSIELQAENGMHASTEPAPTSEASFEDQLAGAKLIGYLAGRNSLQQPLKDSGLMAYIQNDSRLSDALAEGAVAGLEDKVKGK